ncbi:MAG: DUF3775 domain-containing protein [Rhizomicrobium sp.]
MLKHLKDSDIQAVILLCEKMTEKSSNPTGDARNIDAASHTEYDRLYKLIAALSKDAQNELVALMWTGRVGAGAERSFGENLEQATKSKDNNQPEYIAGKSKMLPTYLKAGLARLKKS